MGAENPIVGAELVAGTKEIFCVSARVEKAAFGCDYLFHS
jgi:hypothetical protein